MIDASGGILDQDYEMFEQQTPHALLHHEYLQDSGGPGQWRGGLGVETKIKLGGDDTTMVVFGDGNVKTPYGLFGGKTSVLNKISLTLPDGTEKIPMSKDMIEGIPTGTLYHQIAGGGGGYGNPENRNKISVLKDVKNEVVSESQATNVYGIEMKEKS